MDADPHVTVVGCGQIGLPFAAALAGRAVRVLGVESEPSRLARLNSLAIDQLDVGLVEAARAAMAAGRLSFQAALQPLPHARTFVIAVATPVDDARRPIRAALDTAFRQILASASPGDLVALRSTVPVGATRDLAAIAAAAGLNLLFACCPDRSLAGQSLVDQSATPHLIGPLSAAAGIRAADLMSRLGRVTVLANPEAAELAKLLCNVQRDVSFALANQFALISEALGLNFAEIASAAGQDYARFQVARPGPVGGPCLTKDAYLLAESVGWRDDLTGLILAARAVNDSLLDHALAVHARVEARTAPNPPVVAILGAAFKGRPATRDQRDSFGRRLGAAIRRRRPDADLRVWDPEIDAPARADRLDRILEGADVAFVAHDHAFFQQLDLPRLARRMAGNGLIVDYGGAVQPPAAPLPNGIRLMRFGATG